nr:MAG TPA: hypothetical protein [Caudoviricetes sp.]
MRECLSDKWSRLDVADFLTEFYPEDVTARQMEHMLQQNVSLADSLMDKAAKRIEWEIKNRKVTFPEIRYSVRYDGNSGKLREIGVESIKQQIYDYVAVNALMELFERKIGKYQCASVPGRGQVYGKKAIEKWIRKYPDKTRVGAKADVRHCYPSINTKKLMKLLRKQVKNEDLLYLVETLIGSYKQGLSIGSYLSQWLCNYYLSFAYQYAQQKLFKVQKRRGQEKRTRLFYKIIFYMDDILILGPRKADVKKAMLMMIQFFREELDLEIKPNWKLFQVDYIGKDGKHHGDCIDMMGYKIYRDRAEVRRSIFLRARRAYLRLRKQVQRRMEIALDLAYRCISYFGWFKHSDSTNFKKKYGIEQLMKYAKRRVSIESKIHNRTAGSTLAAA